MYSAEMDDKLWNDAYEYGFQCSKEGRCLNSCPYDSKSEPDLYDAWHLGYGDYIYE